MALTQSELNRRNFTLGSLVAMAFGDATTKGFNNPSVITANQIVTVKGGVFLYNPNKGPNNLVASSSPVQTTDKYGNKVFAGTAVYWFNSGLNLYQAVVLDLVQRAVAFYNAATEAGPWNLISRIAEEDNGLGSGILALFNASQVAININSQNIAAFLVGNPFFTMSLLHAGLAHTIRLATDPDNRWSIDTNGTMQWGSGASPVDTTLYRAGPAELASDSIAANIAGSPETWHVLAPTVAGWSGQVIVRRLNEAGGLFYIEYALSAAAGTVITPGEILCYLPGGYAPAGYSGFINGYYSLSPAYVPVTVAPAQLNGGGFGWSQSGLTVPAGEALFWQGHDIYTATYG